MKVNNPNQIVINFDEQKEKSSISSSNIQKEAKQIQLNPRKEIYDRILNRKME